MMEWISIATEKPDAYRKTIVAFSYSLPVQYRNPLPHKNSMKTTSAYMDKNGKFHLDEKDNFYENVSVRYWMYYPKPPTENEVDVDDR